MAGRGPAPAREHTRKSNDRKQINLVSDGKMRGPALPKLVDAAGNPVTWHARTVRYWSAWRKSPQALRMLTAVDWEYLLVTARVHHEFWTSGRWELAAELRLREAKFGATPEDRSRLGYEMGTAGKSEEEAAIPAVSNVSSIDDRRKRLTAQA